MLQKAEHFSHFVEIFCRGTLPFRGCENEFFETEISGLDQDDVLSRS